MCIRVDFIAKCGQDCGLCRVKCHCPYVINENVSTGELDMWMCLKVAEESSDELAIRNLEFGGWRKWGEDGASPKEPLLPPRQKF